MYTHSNPFVQGGWSGAFSSTIGGDVTNPPSIYGALPMTTGSPSAGSKSGATHFQFTNPNPTILNSIVVGPHRDGTIHQLVNISTDDRLAGYTAFRDADHNRGVTARRIAHHNVVSRCETCGARLVVKPPHHLILVPRHQPRASAGLLVSLRAPMCLRSSACEGLFPHHFTRTLQKARDSITSPVIADMAVGSMVRWESSEPHTNGW